MLFFSHTVLSAPGIVYVDSNANGANKGTSWSQAYTNLQEALTNTSAGEIWVAAGSYKPGDARVDTFQLKNNVALYGGFSGIEDTREQRDPTINETILNGDLLDDDYHRFVNGHGVWSGAGDNSHHVVTAVNVDATAVIDGFVVEHGWAYGAEIQAGGGLLIRNSSPTVSNTIIDGGSGAYGGGAYIDQGSTPTFTDCEFYENYSDIGYGGAMHIAGSSHVSFSNCHFQGNAAIGTQSPAGYGGALYIGFGSTATIVESSFVGNITGYRTYTTGGAYSTKGGAILAGGEVSVQDSFFIGNRSHNGGAIYAFGSVTLINNVFNGNSVTTAPGDAGGGYGGALILTGTSTLTNNTIVDNNATEGTGGVIASVGADESIDIVNTILWGNTVSKYTPPGEDPLPVSRNQLARGGNVSMSYGILEGLNEAIPGEDPVDPANFPGVLDADPLFDSSADGDFHLSAGSPAIDSGDNRVVNIATDLDGEPRLQDDPATPDTGKGVAPIVDMGAYEFTGSIGDNIPPLAAASATPATGEVPLLVDFNSDDSSDDDGYIVAYNWDFDNGSSSSEANPSFDYQLAGNYTVVLTVTDDQGAARSDSVTITVTDSAINSAPVAIATSDVDPDEAVEPLLVEFDGSKSYDDGQIVSYSWDLGDGSTGAGDSTKHTYSAGSYTVILSVTDDEGATAEATLTFTVDPDPGTPPPENQTPVAQVSADQTTGVAPLSVNFDGSASSDSDGTITLYSWNFGDGANATGTSVAHNYEAGSYTARLTVTDDQGATDMATVMIVVDGVPPPANLAPIAQVSADQTTGVAPLSVNFDGSASSDSDGTITLYSWNFGDGANATGTSVTHNYDVGSYTAMLTVTDDQGATGEATVAITVDSDTGTATAPAAPTNLTLALVKTGKGKNKVITGATINWTDNSDNEENFIIEQCLETITGKGKRRVTTCDFVNYTATGIGITSYSIPTDSGYRYRVRAINAAGESAPTNEVSI
jgi:PKD repeat protein